MAVDERILDALLAANEKLPHRDHQKVGVQALLEHPFFLLADEVGAGKSKQVVDTAQILFLDHREIDTVMVITPGFARSTWAEEDPLLGEVAKHAWDVVPNVIHEYHKYYTDLDFTQDALHWVVSNYEFIRREDRLLDLLDLLKGRKVLLVLDESWALANFSEQMKACRRIRVRRAKRVVELNGTPLADGAPEDLYYPMNILDPSILDVESRAHFKSEYCIMGGYLNKKVVKYRNLDQLNAKIAPYVLSRRTRDCFDLPPMLPPVIIEARMSPTNWGLYCDQRDDMVSWLGNQASISKQAIVKILRLSQITSGYLGGLEEMFDDPALLPGGTEPTNEPVPQWLRAIHNLPEGTSAGGPLPPVAPPVGITPKIREIGREKLDAFLNWFDTRTPTPHKILVWCRFTLELERAAASLAQAYAPLSGVVLQLKGNQSKADRRAAKDFLAPGGDPRPGGVVGNQKAGNASLNFAAADTAVYLSNGPELLARTQSIGRIERPGATRPMSIIDVVAVGPKGQKTIDHHILRSLRAKDDMAQWTVDQWRKILAGK